MESCRDELISLIEYSDIKPENIDEVVFLTKIKPTKNAWLVFINHLLLWVGCIALSLSVIFFIAFNWSKMGRFAKFTLVEFSLVLSIVAYLKVKLTSVASSAILIFATLMLGALMALFGQTYQTGADPWQLFFYWAILITPWAVIGRFASIWIIWLVLINFSIALYCDIYLNPLAILFDSKTNLAWTFFSFHFFSFIVWYLLSPLFLWMQKQWAIRILALSSGISITNLVISAIFNHEITNSLALPVWAVFFVTIYWLYRKRTIDLFMLAGTCLSVMLVTIFFLGTSVLEPDDPGSLLLLSLVVIGLGVASAFWLKKVQMESQL
jgi:uncharacterized membrane protein